MRQKLVLSLVLSAFIPTLAIAQERVVTPEVSIEQERLLKQTPQAGGYDLRKVLESGSQFFTTPYVDGDGYGEGPRGPRAIQRSVFYPYVARAYGEEVVLDNGRPSREKSGPYGLPFLRLDGIDSQSCFECHHSIGVYHEPGTVSGAMTRKPGVVGGAAGRANTLFQNPDWPTRLAIFYRSPPHVFGTGYGQRLADEMTLELQVAKAAADTAAERDPGAEKCLPLQAKTSAFGTYCATFEDGKLHEDLSQVEGVASDLVIRPFQFKGIASSVRHFVESALDFHFSIQSVEKTAANRDCDLDGRYNEMAIALDRAKGSKLEKAIDTSLGNVAALSAFVAMTRPPQQVIERAKKDSIERGERLFRGEDVELTAEAAGLCAQCHTPALRIDVPVVTVARAEAGDDCPIEATGTLGSSSFDHPGELPVMQLFHQIESDLKDAAPDEADVAQVARRLGAALGSMKEGDPCHSKTLPEGYSVHLTEPGRCTGAAPNDLPPYIYPRLRPNRDGTVDVPLYSDLKLHDMGQGLADVEDQETDVAGVFVPRRQFLTRPLWGASSSNPWLHDGRSTTLRDAILRHRSEGSEANPVIGAFEALTEEQQADVVNFLLSLVLPVAEGTEAVNACPTSGCTTVCPTDGCVYEAVSMQ